MSDGCAHLTDEELLLGFEQASLVGSFRHRDHLRVAWLYLRALPFEEGARRLAAGIQRLAAASGKPEKYDPVLTSAYLALIQARLGEAGARELTFDAFLEQYPELSFPIHRAGAVSASAS